ncbi:hypothetical protein ATANTOWER_032899 [Ataeniobius toweri]|uniref:Uncharacterized protein n=1 Tax=Ataeniobius toweri TaxID=208326 RepID=A0ABU7BDR4_9TELE|nr:hypothetical protein [Ataeniobius toweri]
MQNTGTGYSYSDLRIKKHMYYQVLNLGGAVMKKFLLPQKLCRDTGGSSSSWRTHKKMCPVAYSNSLVLSSNSSLHVLAAALSSFAAVNNPIQYNGPAGSDVRAEFLLHHLHQCIIITTICTFCVIVICIIPILSIVTFLVCAVYIIDLS